jgi:hypothetical protein
VDFFIILGSEEGHDVEVVETAVFLGTISSYSLINKSQLHIKSGSRIVSGKVIQRYPFRMKLYETVFQNQPHGFFSVAMVSQFFRPDVDSGDVQRIVMPINPADNDSAYNLVFPFIIFQQDSELKPGGISFPDNKFPDDLLVIPVLIDAEKFCNGGLSLPLGEQKTVLKPGGAND